MLKIKSDAIVFENDFGIIHTIYKSCDQIENFCKIPLKNDNGLATVGSAILEISNLFEEKINEIGKDSLVIINSLIAQKVQSIPGKIRIGIIGTTTTLLANMVAILLYNLRDDFEVYSIAKRNHGNILSLKPELHQTIILTDSDEIPLQEQSLDVVIYDIGADTNSFDLLINSSKLLKNNGLRMALCRTDLLFEKQISVLFKDSLNLSINENETICVWNENEMDISMDDEKMLTDFGLDFIDYKIKQAISQNNVDDKQKYIDMKEQYYLRKFD